MDFNELRQIIELFSRSNVDRLELEKEGFSFRLAKKTSVVVQSVDVPRVGTQPTAGHLTADEAASSDTGQIYVTSPIVGTFYRAPNPSAPNFVEVGTRVAKGQTLCIVEAMKLMNEIQADHAGEVVQILAENGQGIEYGQKLFALKPL